MKKQHGMALLEVLIAVSILGVITVGVMQLQSRQMKSQFKTLAAAKVAKIYQLSTQVMFDPLVKRKDSTDDISSWKINDTIKGLKDSITTGVEYIYLDVKTSSNQIVANFFNGAEYGTSNDSCDPSLGVDNERVNCSAGLRDTVILGTIYRVRGIKVNGAEQSFFSINHIDNSNISDVKPTVITIFIDGLHGQEGLKDIYDVAEAVSEQVSQIDDMENSAYADIHIADFSGAVTTYDTGINAHEALLDDRLMMITGDMGLAIVFELDGTQALRSDGMVAMQESRSLCWNVTVGAAENDVICQSAISSIANIDNGLDGNLEPSRFLQTDGNLLYQTADQVSPDKVYRTPVEVVVDAFDASGNDIIIAKPVCPTIQGNELLPHLSVISSSFSGSHFGDFPEVDASDYGDNSISSADEPAELVSGVLFRWEDIDGLSWSLTGIVGSPNDVNGDDGKNPESLQIVALRWCEVEKS
ncbi:prepilin-type N-terminal cleavage/methylation domain-containing protein [Shewanella psychropiezotolerans]|uniref:Prepilin-type N-terminal cleavage/methylation domain-containing protein n=1 Tax=Shewanella psychropiezotolerans TaxID=2593655 RepID=A0ABX5WWB5_9GAMM|nr:prepilin-type N-terminal cleavage/methylation domain-containing protein [Shewanella psychropiezotolerans]QDO83329.1 prepilin-type N-terminal cleavage/methylation domain-containing protein [Shewanella psychropiezotolerans]